MKFLLLFYFSLMLSCATPSQMANSIETQRLFTEEDNDWSLRGEASWTIDKGIIEGQGGIGYAFTTITYDNFILELEFYPDATVNSGIFLRCPQKEASAVDCYEINIWDDHANQEYRTGSIVRHGKPLAQLNSVGKWNSYRIKALDDHIEVWLNGVKTADLKDQKSANGYLGLQAYDNGVIKFRNVNILKL